MTRRPYMPHASKVTRASHLLTAPGKKWSESPTAQPGPVRPPRQVATPPSIVLPTEFYWQEDFMTFPSSVNVLQWMGSGTYECTPVGCLVAVIIITEAVSVTPPAGWSILYSHTFTNFTYYIGVTNSNPDEASAVWTFDWTGVSSPQQGELAYRVFSFWDDADGTSGLVWDIEYVNHDGQTSGTWLVPTNSTWLYSIASVLTENCEQNWGTYHGPNAYGSYVYTYNVAYENAWIATPVPIANASLKWFVSTWEIDAIDINGDIWRPDYFYDSITTPYYTGTPSNGCVLLGVKPG